MITEAISFKQMSSSFEEISKRKSFDCSINEAIFTTQSVMYMTKGHPLLQRFNQVFMRVVEAGMYNKYLSELQYRACSQNGEREESFQNFNR